MKLNLRAKTEPEVNLTSLIDVVLLLLIFFMVSTSFVKAGTAGDHDYGAGHLPRQRS